MKKIYVKPQMEVVTRTLLCTNPFSKESPISSGKVNLAISVTLTFSRFETLFSYRGTVIS